MYTQKGVAIMNTCIVQRWGNSQGIRIPKPLLQNLGIKENETLSLSIEDNKLIIQKAIPQKLTMKTLFAGYKGKYEPSEIDWGDPQGAEIW